MDRGITLPDSTDTDIKRIGSRLIAVPIKWGGHSFRLVNVYLQSGNAAGQRFFIQQHVPGLVSQPANPAHQIWGGDFNFVEDPSMDRFSTSASYTSRDNGTGEIWRNATPNLTDQFRRLKPHSKSYSRLARGSASRIDRLYATHHFNSFIAKCTTGDGTGFSDHRPVTLTLNARTPTQGPGLPRTRTTFAKDPGLRQQFDQWLSHRIPHLPTDHQQLLDAWPAFKRSIAAECGRLNKLYRLTKTLPSYRQANEALKTAHQQMELPQVTAEQVTAAITDAEVARQQLAQATCQQRRHDTLRHRHKWFHRGERPQPAITRALRPRTSDARCAALLNDAQHLVTDGKQCANIMVKFWSDISKSPTTDADAQQQVLQELSAGCTIDPAEADALGSADVTAAEVMEAIKQAPGASSPGLDGIPFQLYRLFKQELAAPLAAIFSAMGNLRQTSEGLLDGAICSIIKTDEHGQPMDRSQRTNYRPITLLSTDYRLLAKILANRANPILAQVIDAEQTAFLKDRDIGENIMLLQALPSLMKCRGLKDPLVVLCDFTKAYDTICRSFLLKSITALGAGDGFVRWVSLLLTNTRACAVTNGFRSGFREFEAGVRQGCPLSPLLYLFVATALLRFLKQQSLLGISIHGGPKLVATQYADDTQVFLQDMHRLPAFVRAMRIFGNASGQRLNEAKTKAMWLLNPYPARPLLPRTAHGFRLVTTAKVLGIHVGEDAPPAEQQWNERISKLEKVLGKVVGMPLSIFGRAFCSSAYAVSTVLYHAEFSEQPTPQQIHRLTQLIAKVVEAGLHPLSTRRVFRGVRAEFLAGRPRDGGFGSLAWLQHIRSRHVKWATKLCVDSTEKPWVSVARELLRLAAPNQQPPLPNLGHEPLDILTCVCTGPNSWDKMGPEPLRRLFRALATFPRVSVSPPEPGIPLGPHNYMWAANRTATSVQVFSVRVGTALQCGEIDAERRSRFLDCITSATRQLADDNATVHIVDVVLPKLFRAMWFLPLENGNKEVFWRLLYNAIPSAERMGRPQASCQCTEGCSTRMHHFWECPVAHAIISDIQQSLAAFPPAAAHSVLQPRHIWLALRPCIAVHWGVWNVVVLAALNAMDKGRRALYRVQQRSREQHREIPAALLVDIATRCARAEFRGLLLDFVHLGMYKGHWVTELRALGPTHPFLRVMVGENVISTHI